MQEFDCIKVSSYEAETLSAKLTERSADGWDVVSIVAAGSDVVAYLSRESNGVATAAAPAAAATAAAEEPSGWGSAPAATPEPEPATPAEPTPAASDTGWGTTGGGGSWGASSSPSGGESWGSSTSSEPAASTPAAAASSPSVPAGWYSDPANRYELRYWDGSAWTEHVSRGGQQYTDPPVA